MPNGASDDEVDAGPVFDIRDRRLRGIDFTVDLEFDAVDPGLDLDDLERHVDVVVPHGRDEGTGRGRGRGRGDDPPGSRDDERAPGTGRRAVRLDLAPRTRILLERVSPELVTASGSIIAKHLRDLDLGDALTRLAAGEVAPPVTVPARSLQRLLVTALVAEGRTVVWRARDSRVAVHLQDTEVAVHDGAVVVTFVMETAETGRATVVVPFAVGTRDHPAGMLAVAPGRVGGNTRLAALFGEAATAAAWRALVQVTQAVAGLAAEDRDGHRVVPGALVAGNGRLEIEPQAQHDFVRRVSPVVVPDVIDGPRIPDVVLPPDRPVDPFDPPVGPPVRPPVGPPVGPPVRPPVRPPVDEPTPPVEPPVDPPRPGRPPRPGSPGVVRPGRTPGPVIGRPDARPTPPVRPPFRPGRP